MLVCTVLNRMTLDLRAFSTTGGWFSATRAGSDMTSMSHMPGFKARSSAATASSNTLAELTLSRQYADTKWKDDDDYVPANSQLSTFVHPPAFDEIEMNHYSVGRAR